jgi:hypothetical protein
MADEKNTDAAGAVPADKGANAGLPTDKKIEADADSSPEVVKDKDGKPLPWDQQPKWKAARQAEKRLNALLKANDLDDPDDLEDLVKSGKVVKGKLSDLNSIDEILAKSAKLDSYEAYWAAEKAKHQKATEDPSERADRLERELEGEKGRKRFEENQKRQMEQTKQAISNYEKEVQTLIGEIGVPKDQSPFILELFGVGNPSNDVDITDRKAIKKLVADGVKRLDAFKQSVIADYLKEKKGIVKTGQGSEAVTGEKPVQTNLKTMRKSLHEQMSNLYRGAM